MTDVARTAAEMITRMTPALQAGDFVFLTTRDAGLAAGLAGTAVATFREDEGLSLVVPIEAARRHGLPVDQPMRRITLTVHSALDGVGLTAAVAAALAARNIPCNMIAAFHHDHVFVPSALADAALDTLRDLQQRGAGH